jgi:hypothetical protein
MNMKSLKEVDIRTIRWDLRALRLPKLVEADPHGARLLSDLAAQAKLLWPQGAIAVPEVQLGAGLREVLQKAHKAGRVVRGLESTERKLAAEEHGLGLADQQSGVLRGGRVSRLLILADNGAERFYRQVEKLLRRHGPRVLALRLNVSAETLGEMLFGPGRRALLLMLDHKEAVGAVLLALAAPSGGPLDH